MCILGCVQEVFDLKSGGHVAGWPALGSKLIMYIIRFTQDKLSVSATELLI